MPLLSYQMFVKIRILSENCPFTRYLERMLKRNYSGSPTMESQLTGE